MFKLNPKLKRLDVPAQSVLRLQRSHGDVQTAFPGWSSQRATAYVCAFSTEKGARVAVAFYMKESCELVFYLNDEGDVARGDLGKLFSEGVYFAESLGFMLGDVDLSVATPAEREALWAAQPLRNPPQKAPPPPVETKDTSAVEPTPSGSAVDGQPPKGAKGERGAGSTEKAGAAKSTPPLQVPVVRATKERPVKATESAQKPVAKTEPQQVELDLGLSPRSPLVALRRRKDPPSAEELEQKRKKLRENLGRFFASM